MRFLQSFNTDTIAKSELSRNDTLYALSEEDISKIQQVLLSMAKDLAAVCEKNDIPYLLGGGSALGARRHKGFIPWDDDMDINVRRQDIDRLMQLIEEEYPEKYRVMGPEMTEGFFSSFYEIQMKDSVFREFAYQKDEECGIKIDIYPMENTYNSLLRRFVHGIGTDAGLLLLSCIRIFWHRKEWLTLARGNSKARSLIKAKAAIGAVFYRSRWKWFSRVQRWIRRCKDDNSNCIVMPTGRRHFFGEIFRRDPYCKTCLKPFEDTEFRVSVVNDRYLRQRYGKDYMVIPAEDKRDRHVLYDLRFPDE